MTDGPPDAPRKTLTWADTFRLFQVALDPRKLVVAAAGILAMAVGWYLLSLVFWAGRTVPSKDDPAFSNATIQKEWAGKKRPDGKDYTEDDLRDEGERRLKVATEEYATWKALAGPGGFDEKGQYRIPGRLRALPWYEYRGPNPFTLVTDAVGGTAVERQELASGFLSGTVPVLVEPLFKLLLPVVKLVDPYATFWQRVYLLLCLVWSVAVWAFFGGVITRIAAVQLSGKDRVTLPEAVKFVIDRYTGYVLSPLVPVGLILFIVALMAIYGTVAVIPFVGDVLLYGLLFPLVLLGGVVIAVLLVGLTGYPLMFATVSTEGTDTFDALSRSYNYVFQAPWTYLTRWLAAIFYGAVVTFVVVFLASLAVYMGKWAISQALLTDTFNRRPDYLFVYAPESFGWKELLVRNSPVEQNETTAYDLLTGRKAVKYEDRDEARAKAYRDSLLWTERAGAGLTAAWLTLALLVVVGFSYSYFWCASTLVYLAMREAVDETEPDEVYLDDDVPEPLPPPATGVTTATGPAAGGLTLPTTTPATPEPVAPPITVPPVVPPASPAVTVGAVTAPADSAITTVPPPPADGVK